MNSNDVTSSFLKKGFPDDLLIQLDERCQKYVFFKKFLEFIMDEKFIINFSEMENINMIKFYLQTTKKKIKRKKKTESPNNTENDGTPKNKQKAGKQSKNDLSKNKKLESILNKYVAVDENSGNSVLFEESKNEKKTKEKKSDYKNAKIEKKELEDNFSLKMNLLVIDSEIFSNVYNANLEKINENLDLIKKKDSELENTNVKYLILCEGLQNFFSSKNFKSKNQVNLTSSQYFFSEENLLLSEESFNDWLCDISVLYSFEYYLTEEVKDSLEYLKSAMASLILIKYKNLDINIINKENSHTEKSKISGFDNEFSLMWIDILMGIPGMSEDRAIAIAKNYNSLRNFMKMLENKEDENKLKNLQIYYNYNQSKSKNLGGVLSSKLSKVFTEKDPSKLAKD